MLNILLVEDDAAHALAIQDAFAKHAQPSEAVRVTTVGSVAEAQNHLDRTAPDLIVADLLLLGSTSIRRLSSEAGIPAYPIIIMARPGHEQAAIEAMKAGAVDYVIKSDATMAQMPRIARRALREWEHIAKRREAEDALRQSQEFLDNIINAIPAPIFVKDEQHRLIVLNDAACAAVGQAREELLGKTDYDIFPREQADIFVAHDRVVFQTNAPSFEEEEVTWQGRVHTVVTSKSAFVDSGSGARYIAGTVQDITKHKRATRELERLRRMLDQARDTVFLIDPETGQLLYCNDSATRRLGYTRDELLALNIRDIEVAFPVQSEAQWRYQIDKVRSGVASGLAEGMHRCKDGSSFPVEISITQETVAGKEYLLAVARDITQRKAAEEALRKSEVKYAKVFHANPHSITISALPSGRLIEVNEHFLTVTGKQRGDVIGRIPDEFGLWADPAKRDHIIELVMAGKRVVNEEVEIRLPPDRVDTCLISAERMDLGGEPCMIAIVRNIAERKQIEEALRHSEERLKVLFEYAPDAYYMNDLKGNFIDGNKAAEELIGYERRELIGKNFVAANLLPAGQIPKALALLASNALGRSTGPDELTLRRKDGRRVPIEIRTYPVKIQGQTLVLGIARDVTERRKTEAVLREQEERLRTIFDNSPDAIFVEDLDGYVLDVNPAACRLHGTKREDLIGRHVRELVPAEQEARVDEEFNRLVEGEVEYIEGYSLTQDGRAVPVEIRANRIMYTNEEQAAILLHVRDVTKRKKAEEEVTRLKNFYEQVLDELPMQIAVFDAEMRFLYINPSAISNPETRQWMIGKTDEDYCRRRGFDLAIAQQRIDVLQKVARQKETVHFEESLQNHAGKREHHMRFVSPVLNEAGEVVQFIGYGLNITARKQAEEELQQYRDHLEELVEQRTTELQQINQQLRQEIAERERIETALKREIAERKEAETALLRSKERYHALFEQAPVMYVITKDDAGEPVISDCNQLFLDTLGYQFDEVLERPLAAFYTAESEAHLLKEGGYQRALQGQFVQEERQLVTREGRIVETLLRAVPEQDAQGQVFGTRAMFADITARKHMEQELHEKVFLLEEAQRISHLGVWKWDIEPDRVTWSDELYRIYGLDSIAFSASFEGYLEKVHPDDRSDVQQLIQASLQAQEPVTFEERIVRPNGEVRHLHSWGDVVQGPQGRPVQMFGVCMDVTERKQAEEELQLYRHRLEEIVQERTTELEDANQQLRQEIQERERLEGQIRQHNEELEHLVKERTERIQELERQRAEAEKLVATGRMAAGIAHEINNPLASIMSSFELVKGSVSAEHPRYEFVQRIEDDLDRVARIIRHMYNLYKPVQEEAQTFEVDTILKELAALLEAYCRQRDLTLVITPHDAKHLVHLPPTSMHQVLSNIVRNALDASPPGSTVEVVATTTPHTLSLTVTDQGDGIPEEIQKKIFEPFFTSKQSSGMGLGLSIAQSLVGAMGGTITFESRAGEGTAFQITLPRTLELVGEDLSMA